MKTSESSFYANRKKSSNPKFAFFLSQNSEALHSLPCAMHADSHARTALQVEPEFGQISQLPPHMSASCARPDALLRFAFCPLS